jgi:hypothetical protein
MRKIIAGLQVSLDGFIEGPNGELDWVRTWEDSFDLLPQIDTCILGRGMYPGYEQYWRAILANPDGILPFTGKVASMGEIAYARFADKTPQIVLSKTLGGGVPAPFGPAVSVSRRHVRLITESQLKPAGGKNQGDSKMRFMMLGLG